MKTVIAVAVLLCFAAVATAGRVAQRGYVGRPAINNQPYWFLGGPRPRATQGAQAIQVPISLADLVDDEDDEDQEDAMALVNDDEEDENSFDEELEDDLSNDDEDEQELGVGGGNIIGIVPLAGGKGLGKNYLRSVLARNGGNAGSIMVPDGIIELEGQGIVDEETGETALFVSREALAGIPDGSVVALVEDTDGLGKANKVIVRRRRKGNRVNKKRGNRRRRRGGNRRVPNGIRVIRGKPIRINNNRVNGNRRRRVPSANIIRI